MVLADDTSPAFMARGMNALLMAMMIDGQRLAYVLPAPTARSAGATTTSACSAGPSGSSGPATARFLTTAWIPALDGVEERLLVGARVPPTSVVGTARRSWSWPTPIRLHHPRVRLPRRVDRDRASARGRGRGHREHAVRRCRREGVRGVRTTSSASSTASTTWAIPWASRLIAQHLEPGGTVLLVEPMALDDRDNIAENPLAASLYTASSAICTPNSLSQEVGLGARRPGGRGPLAPRCSRRRGSRTSGGRPSRPSTSFSRCRPATSAH